MKSKPQTAFAGQRPDETSVSRAWFIASKLGIINPGGGSYALVDHAGPASDSGTTRGFPSGSVWGGGGQLHPPPPPHPSS